MKKKFTRSILALVCALCCAFGLAACNNDEESNTVACTLTATPEHVIAVHLEDGNSYMTDLGKRNNIWSTPKQIAKGKECKISLILDTFYELGSLKVSVNGTEIALTKNEGTYCGVYTPTADFTVTVSGEAELEKTSVVLNQINWQPCYDYYNGDDDAQKKGEKLKANIGDNFYITLLVNGTETMPFKKLGLTTFSFDGHEFKANIKKSDNIEIVLYTNSSALEIYNENALSIDYAVGADVNWEMSSDKKSLSVKIDGVADIVTISIRVDCIAEIAE